MDWRGEDQGWFIGLVNRRSTSFERIGKESAGIKQWIYFWQEGLRNEGRGRVKGTLPQKRNSVLGSLGDTGEGGKTGGP